MRAMIGAVLFQFPSTWASNFDEYLQKGLALFDQYKNHPRIGIVFAPHATYTVDDETFIRMEALARQFNTKIHIHLNETKREIHDHLQHHKCTPIQRLEKLGLLNSNLIAVHMTQLTDEEVELVSNSGVHVVHCVESNLKLGSGICPVSKLLSKKINVCLGTDGPASNDDLDMLGEMRTSALIDKFRIEDPPIPGWKMLELATINGAKALGIDHLIGSIEVGKQADLISVKLNTYPIYNPVHTLVYVGTNRVDYVWVNGKLLLEREELKTVDMSKVKADAECWREKISTWDTNRKTFNLKIINTELQTIQEAVESLEKGSDQNLENSLNILKENCSHWIYFAKRGELKAIEGSLASKEESPVETVKIISDLEEKAMEILETLKRKRNLLGKQEGSIL